MELINSDAICFLRRGRAPAADGMYKKEATHMADKGEKMEGMPVGNDDFREVRDLDCYYVDKSPLIDMILKDKSKVKLFTRPRRFGKSLNLSMLDAYLNIKYAGERDRFTDLKISQLRPDDSEKTSNIVINLNFKDLKTQSYDAFEASFKNYVINLYGDFEELASSEKVPSTLKRWYKELVEGTADYDTLTNSIKYLCQMIEKHYGKKPIILIDEYDQPMNTTYGRPELHESVKDLMRYVLGGALKTNTSLRFAVLTGVMRISKESIFSGLNNPKVYDVLSTGCDEMFGFTQAEVEKILIDNGYEDKIDEAREWYDGYRFGDADIYNPWSILNYIDEGCKPNPYWASTSGNSIVGDLISRVDSDTWKKLEILCSGGAVSADLRKEIAYCDLQSSINSIYPVMVASGYLKAIPQGGGYVVSIPNKEMFSVFATTILERYGNSVNKDVFDLIEAMAAGDTEKMAAALENQMELLSNRILTHEHVYQGFIAGLMAIVHGRYEVSAEREVMDGYYDVRLKRVSGSGSNLLIEIKRRNENNADKTMEELAREGLRQIHEKGYAEGLTGETILYGVAFDGKRPTIAMERL